MKKMRFIVVMPFDTDNIPLMAGEIERVTRSGADAVALAIDFNPGDRDPAAHFRPIAAAFREVRRCVPKAELGAWGPVIGQYSANLEGGSLPQRSWQSVVRRNGEVASGRFCWFDPGFRRHIAQLYEEFTRAGSDFFMLDDDYTTRPGECFCPLHRARFNRGLEKPLTREELGKLAAEAPDNDPLIAKFEKVRSAAQFEFARMVRAAVDRVNPSIPIGLCNPAEGHPWIEKIALILAGPRTEPFIRIACGVYGYTAGPNGMVFDFSPMYFPYAAQWAAFRIKAAGKVRRLIAESDCFPCSYHCVTPRTFHAHTVSSIINGLCGGLWMFYNSMGKRDYARKYEETARLNRPMYDELLRTVSGIHWLGVLSPIPEVRRTGRAQPSRQDGEYPDWNRSLLCRFGIPGHYADTEGPAVRALTGYLVDRLTDKELQTFFRGGLLLDATAVKKLTERGFADLMGVRAEGPPQFNMGYLRSSGEDFMLSPTKESAVLVPVSGSVVSLADAAMPDRKSVQCPAAAAFVNRLGGRVVTCAFPAYVENYAQQPLRQGIQRVVEEAVDFISGGRLPLRLETELSVLVRHGRLAGGGELLFILNLSVDPLGSLVLRSTRTLRKLAELQPDGSWRKVNFVQHGDRISIRRHLACIEPAVYKMKF